MVAEESEGLSSVFLFVARRCSFDLVGFGGRHWRTVVSMNIWHLIKRLMEDIK
jgi:hypothetical protein